MKARPADVDERSPQRTEVMMVADDWSALRPRSARATARAYSPASPSMKK